MIVEAWEQYWELDFDRRGKVKDFGKRMEWNVDGQRLRAIRVVVGAPSLR